MTSLKGTVARGRGKGASAGMPTANLLVKEGELPPWGVYASLVHVGGQIHLGVTNVGLRPSVDSDSRPTVETYMPDFPCRDLYGEEIELELVEYLRPTMKMAGLAEVKAQVDRDCARAREILSSRPIAPPDSSV